MFSIVAAAGNVTVTSTTGDLVVTTVAVAVVVTLTLQATTKGWLARRLDLLEDGEYVGPPSPGLPKASASEASA